MTCTGTLPSRIVITCCLWLIINTCLLPTTFVICRPCVLHYCHLVSTQLQLTNISYPRVEVLFLCVMSTLCLQFLSYLVCVRFSEGRFQWNVRSRLMDFELLQFRRPSSSHSRVTVGKLLVHAVVKYFCCRLYLCYEFCRLDLWSIGWYLIDACSPPVQLYLPRETSTTLL